MKKLIDDTGIPITRSYTSMYIEWYLHNIGYYITLPFPWWDNINARCKDVDLE
jgi:hypothetical protein